MKSLIYGHTSTGKALPVKVGDDGAVATSNITTKYRESFEVYQPNTVDSPWIETLANGDIARLEGNALAASYLVISKSPLFAGTETVIENKRRFAMPLEFSIGLHMSQRTLGQEFAVEIVSDDTVPVQPDLEISSITQATTTLTVVTVAEHGLVPGKRIGITGCSNPLANYPALVVATIPTPTSFTVTAGPGGTIASQTITNPAGAKGFVTFRPALGYAQDGTSMIFENVTVTNASFYIRSDSGDSLPSGTVNGNHSATILTTASVQALNGTGTYAFQPTDEYRLTMIADRVQWSNVPVDSVAAATSVVNRSQVVPNNAKDYKYRTRAANSKSLTVPSAQIVSAVKSGTTTATITTDRDHGLVTGDVVVVYGIRDQAAASFPNLLTATAVASTPATNQFTIVIGTASTVTSYGGYVAKVQGGNLMSALGALTMAAQSATIAAGVLTLVGSAAWSGALIGDFVELVGIRDNTTGASLGLDGAWRVRDIATTNLVLEFIGSGTMPTTLVTTNCGGAVIKRTDLRVSYLRLFDFERDRVEFMPRPTGEIANAVPVSVNNVPNVGTVTTVTGVTTVTTAGTPAVPATPYFLNSAASTNGALILTGTSGLQAFYATNTGAAAAFVKLYNKATAPTVGTDVPEMVIPVPAAVGGVPGIAEITPGFNGHRFALGLGIAITGGAADADTTAVAAGQVKVKLSRTV